MTQSSPSSSPSSSPASLPPERQFDFLLGDWQVQATRLQPDGSTLARYPARWSARALSAGAMVVDDFQALGPDGQVLSSFVTLRTYAAATGRWEMAGLAASQPAARMDWHGVGSEGGMTLWATGADPAGREVHTRIRFSDITPTRFVWASESSLDGGTTWVATASLVATRVQATPA